MIRTLFQRKASYEAEVLAEAQALVDDGLELEFVLELFPQDAEWLRSSLEFVSNYEAAIDSEPASYYFEASLKSKFLAAAAEPRPVVPVVIPAPSFSPLRTFVATMSVASAAAVVGILALGFVTAGDSVPGDWNYAFKRANERFEYTTSRGDDRIAVQLKLVENRVTELNKLSARGDVSPAQVERVQREITDLGKITKNQELDALQKAKIESAGKNAVAVFNDVATKQPDLGKPVAAAAAAIGETVTSLTAPSPTAAATAPTATATATAEPTVATTPEASATPVPSATASPEPSATPEPSPSGTPTPEPTATVRPGQTTTPAPTEGGSATPPVETGTVTPPASVTP